MEIIYNKQIEPHNKAEIASYIAKYSWIIPHWLQKINIDVIHTDDGSLIASACVRERYREADINVCPLWFTKAAADKTDAVIHELLHLHTNPLYDFAKNAMRQFSNGENEKAMDVVFMEMESYLERQVQDLTFAIMNKFNEQ
jgi:hypothetical protein